VDEARQEWSLATDLSVRQTGQRPRESSVTRQRVVAGAIATLLGVGAACAGANSQGPPPLVSATPLVTDGEWFIKFRTEHPLRPAMRGPLQCEVDAFWATQHGKIEATGVRQVTFAPTHHEGRLVWVGWRPELLGDVTVFLDMKRDDSGRWKKGSGWTATECGL